MLRMVLALVMGAHGIGHLIGVVGALRPAGMTWGGSGTSWLLSPVLGQGAAVVEAVLFAAATIGWVGAAVLLLAELESWRGVAVAAAVISLAAIALFPEQLPAGSTVAAVVVNVVALIGLLVVQWPTVEQVGA